MFHNFFCILYSLYVFGFDLGIATAGGCSSKISSSSFSSLSGLTSFTLLHALFGGCSPAHGVDLGYCCCCGVILTESNKEECSPKRCLLPAEFDRSTLTLLILILVSVSLLSWLGGILLLLR